jgi:hypothetical protein
VGAAGWWHEVSTEVATTMPAAEAARGLEDLYAEYIPPAAVLRIDPVCPEWQDDSYGDVIAYNAGTPVLIDGNWLIPVRFEFRKDEKFSVVAWRRWNPQAVPEPDTHPGNEGGYVVRLETLDGGAPGQNEVWVPGQDPSVWTMPLRGSDGQIEQALFMSVTEIFLKDTSPKGKESYGWRTAIYSGRHPAKMERIFTSDEGQKDVFGIPAQDGSMTLVIRPRHNEQTHEFAEAGPGKVALLHLSGAEELRNGIDFTKALIVSDFGLPGEEWVGGKRGRTVGDDTVVLDGAHTATWVPLPKHVQVPDLSSKERKIRGYFATEPVIDYQEGTTRNVSLLAVPWDLRLGAKPKRPDLAFIAFSSGQVPQAARIDLGAVLAQSGLPSDAVDQYIMSYGDSELRLVCVVRVGYDSPEVQARHRDLRAAAEATGRLSLFDEFTARLRQEFGAPGDVIVAESSNDAPKMPNSP